MGNDRHLITFSPRPLPVCCFTHCFTFLELLSPSELHLQWFMHSPLPEKGRECFQLNSYHFGCGMQLCARLDLAFRFMTFQLPERFAWTRDVHVSADDLFGICSHYVFKWGLWRVKSLPGLMFSINMTPHQLLVALRFVVLRKLSEANISFVISGNASSLAALCLAFVFACLPGFSELLRAESRF